MLMIMEQPRGDMKGKLVTPGEVWTVKDSEVTDAEGDVFTVL
jgi:hypothetical protein